MLNLNRAMIIGNATRDVELRTTPNGKSVASFAVATNRRWTDASGEQKDEVQYHEIVCWGKLAEIANQIIRRGSKVYVEGRLQTRNWEGQDGAKRQKTEIIAENLIALSGRSESVSSSTVDLPSQDSDDTPPKPAKKELKKEESEKPNDSDEINLDEIPF